MDVFLRVVTSIPLIDNHDANAVIYYTLMQTILFTMYSLFYKSPLLHSSCIPLLEVLIFQQIELSLFSNKFGL